MGGAPDFGSWEKYVEVIDILREKVYQYHSPPASRLSIPVFARDGLWQAIYRRCDWTSWEFERWSRG